MIRIVSDDDNTGGIKGATIPLDRLSRGGIRKGARPRACHTLDRNGFGALDYRIGYVNMKIRIGLEDHREEFARAIIVERLWVARLMNHDVGRKERQHRIDVVTVP